MDWVSELLALLSAPSPGDNVLPESWVDDVLGFWFEELEPADWFKRSDATDTKIGERFLKLYHNISQMPAEDLARSGRQALAAVIVLDQFPRNLFRGNAQSFATDAKARAIAAAAVKSGFDQEMTLHQRVFLYLPFEHSEDIVDQDRSVALIEALGNVEYTNYAIAHREVIQRFGRFPHRNAALGRTSTTEEEAYLSEPDSGF